MDKQAFLTIIARNIATIREQKGISQAQLAQLCDKETSFIDGVERALINASTYDLYEIAYALGVELNALTKIN